MLRVQGLCTDYADGSGRKVHAVRDVTFEVAQGSFFTLLGPSGSGKTTTLRSVAGLEVPHAGEIAAGRVTVFSARRRVSVPSHKRGFGMVFQSYAIWPHMDVFSNVAFPLRVGRARLDTAQIEREVMRMLDTVQLADLRARDATQLSGGQQQRLALARALVAKPALLLLDEPLSNLDARLRAVMRSELKRLQRELGVTTLYVTHDQSEALAMSDRVAVMRRGCIRQTGSPRDVYERPADPFVADFVGGTNFVDGTVALDAAMGGTCIVDTGLGAIRSFATQPFRAGEHVRLSIRPEDVQLVHEPPTGLANCWRAAVDEQSFVGDAVQVRLCIGNRCLEARAHPALRASAGDTLWACVDAGKSIVMRPVADGEDGLA